MPLLSETIELYRAHIPYSRKIWRGIKFGCLAVYYYNRQIKIRQNFLLAYIRMAIPYRTAKFKSANILSIAILGSTAKFNARQYFRLYGIPRALCSHCSVEVLHVELFYNLTTLSKTELEHAQFILAHANGVGVVDKPQAY